MQFHLKREPIAATDGVQHEGGVCGHPPEGEMTSYAAEKASELLFKVQDDSTELVINAEILRALARQADSNWKSHLAHLIEIKARIRAVWDRTFDLQRISAYSLPWQRETIAELAAHGPQVAASTEAAMDYVNANRDLLFEREYRQHVTALANGSQKIRNAMNKFFGEHVRQEQLRRETAMVLATD